MDDWIGPLDGVKYRAHYGAKGGVARLGALKILALPRLDCPPPPPPYPNPGTLVDLMTKASNCDSQHFDVNYHFWE